MTLICVAVTASIGRGSVEWALHDRYVCVEMALTNAFAVGIVRSYLRAVLSYVVIYYLYYYTRRRCRAIITHHPVTSLLTCNSTSLPMSYS